MTKKKYLWPSKIQIKYIGALYISIMCRYGVLLSVAVCDTINFAFQQARGQLKSGNLGVTLLLSFKYGDNMLLLYMDITNGCWAICCIYDSEVN